MPGRFMIFPAAFLLAVIGAGAANGATVVATGNFAANSQGMGFVGHTSLGPGTYRFSFATSTPIVAGSLFVESSTEYTYFCNDGSNESNFPEYSCGSNSNINSFPFSVVSPLVYQALVTVYPDYAQPGGAPPYVRYNQTDVCCDYFIDFSTINAGRYTLSAGPFPDPGGPVPEPAVWTLMIAGIGASGAAMRRQRNTTLSRA